MRSLFIIIAVGGVAYHFSDARSPNRIASLLMPLVFSLCLLALFVWIYAKSRERADQRTDPADSGAPWFGSGGVLGNHDD
jgi:hypothetical protein